MQTGLKSIYFFVLCAATGLVILVGRFSTTATPRLSISTPCVTENTKPEGHPATATVPPAGRITNQEMAGKVMQSIKAALQGVPGSDHEIDISVLRGEVRLEGIVRNAELRALAEAAASSVPGIVSVENLISWVESEEPELPQRLQIRNEPDQAILTLRQIQFGDGGILQSDNRLLSGSPAEIQRTSQALAERVESAVREAHLKPFELEIRVNDSTATLNGWVTDVEDRQFFVDVAASVAGIDHVENHLGLGKPPSRMPQVGSTMLKANLSWTSPLSSGLLLLAANGSDLFSEVGEPEGPRTTNRERAELVKKALDRALLRNFEIDITVEEEIVELRGSVSNSDQWKLAERTAATVPGIVRVKNLLSVTEAERPASSLR